MGTEFQHKPAKKLNYKERMKAGLVHQKPRKAIRCVSRRMGKNLGLYIEWIKLAMHGLSRCQKCKANSSLQPHHPYGRSGDNLFKVIEICPRCHEWTHAHPNTAMSEGWLQPEYRGLVSDPSHPVPFKLLPR